MIAKTSTFNDVELTVNLAALFPGQGSQFVGMGKTLCKEFPIAELCFEEAEDSVKIPLRSLCFEGPEEELKKTEFTQPAILTHSIAVFRVLKSESSFNPKLFAGHSLGEYSALVAAGVLNFARAVFLVHNRGRFMQEAVPQGEGAMAAVLNVDSMKLSAMCAEVAAVTGGVCELVNYNSPQQIVVAGSKVAVDRLQELLTHAGLKSVSLPVSAPFHSSLMLKARQKMEPLIHETSFQPLAPGVSFVPNVDAELCKDSYQPEFLIRQIDSAVKWQQSMEVAEQAGFDTFAEVGPGRVLFGLGRRNFKNQPKLLHTDDIKETIKFFA